MIVSRIHLAATEPRPAPHVEPVGGLGDVSPHAAEPVGERRNTIALLDPKLLRTRYVQFTAVCRERPEHRKLVDDAWNFIGSNLGRLQRRVPYDDRSGRLS